MANDLLWGYNYSHVCRVVGPARLSARQSGEFNYGERYAQDFVLVIYFA